MAQSGEGDRPSAAMFDDGNRVRFERPVDEAGRRWWIGAFYEPHRLTPEGMGDLITRSVVREKSIVYHYIDGIAHSFALRVEGRFRDGGEVWFVERSLNLDGHVFNADEMFVPSDDAQVGRGRLLMRDLMEAAKLIGMTKIGIEAQKIGRYARLRMGFVPDSGSWRTIQVEAARFIQSHAATLGEAAPRLIAMVLGGRPATARLLAELGQEVPSRQLYDRSGRPLPVPLGKALFLEGGADWTGEFLFDPESVRIAETYIAGAEDSDV